MALLGSALESDGASKSDQRHRSPYGYARIKSDERLQPYTAAVRDRLTRFQDIFNCSCDALRGKLITKVTSFFGISLESLIDTSINANIVEAFEKDKKYISSFRSRQQPPIDTQEAEYLREGCIYIDSTAAFMRSLQVLLDQQASGLIIDQQTFDHALRHAFDIVKFLDNRLFLNGMTPLELFEYFNSPPAITDDDLESGWTPGISLQH